MSLSFSISESLLFSFRMLLVSAEGIAAWRRGQVWTHDLDLGMPCVWVFLETLAKSVVQCCVRVRGKRKLQEQAACSQVCRGPVAALFPSATHAPCASPTYAHTSAIPQYELFQSDPDPAGWEGHGIMWKVLKTCIKWPKWVFSVQFDS